MSAELVILRMGEALVAIMTCAQRDEDSPHPDRCDCAGALERLKAAIDGLRDELQTAVWYSQAASTLARGESCGDG